MKKLLIVAGSPRKNGCCEQLANLITSSGEFAWDVFSLAEKNVQNCAGCGRCNKNLDGVCHIHDGMVELLDSIEKYDGFLFIAPVYMGFISSGLKNFLERFESVISQFKIKGKVLNLVLVGKWPIENSLGRIYSNKEPIEIIKKFFDYYAEIGKCRFNYVNFFQTTNMNMGEPGDTFVYDGGKLTEKIKNVVDSLNIALLG